MRIGAPVVVVVVVVAAGACSGGSRSPAPAVGGPPTAAAPTGGASSGEPVTSAPPGPAGLFGPVHDALAPGQVPPRDPPPAARAPAVNMAPAEPEDGGLADDVAGQGTFDEIAVSPDGTTWAVCTSRHDL